jgi:hypothetical protein
VGNVARGRGGSEPAERVTKRIFYPENAIAPRHHEALLFKRQKIQILNLQKKIQKNLDVAHYDCAIFQYEISCHGSAKKITWSKFERKKNMYCSCS